MPQLAPNPIMAAYYVSALLGVLLTLLVNARGRGPLRERLALMLAMVTVELMTTGTVFAAADARTAVVAARISQAAVLWLPLAAVRFAAAVARRPLLLVRRLLILVTPPLFLVTLFTPLVMAGTRVYPYGYAAVAGPLYPLVLLQMATINLTPVVIFQRLRTEQRPLERRQLINVAAASTVGMFSFIDAVPVMGLDAPPIGWIFTLGAAAGLLLAIVRHRFLDIRMATRRALWWLFSTAVGVSLFAAVTRLALHVTGMRRVPLFLLTGATMMLMRAWLATAQARFDRLVGRRRRDLDAEMALLSDSAATLQTTEALGRAVDRFLRALDRRLAAFVVNERSGRSRVAMSAWGSVPAPRKGSPLFNELLAERALVWRDSARSNNFGTRVEIERACVRWGAEYLAPLIDGDELLGIVAIAPKAGGGLADALELEALDRMSVTVTAALASARLYERLRSLHDELEHKAEARSVSLAKALSDLRGAEQRLVQSEKLAALGQIVGGVAADLVDEVRDVDRRVADVRRHAETLAEATRARLERDPSLGSPRIADMARDVGPLIDALSEGGRRALSIAQDLSRFAPTNAQLDVDEPERAPHRLDELVDGTLKLCAGHLKQVFVVRDYDAGLPPVIVEPGPLGQVVLNLVLNATQAMRGAGTLRIATRKSEVDGRTVAELAVSDTGPGIPPEVLPRIFEPFFSTKGQTLGTGLGLSVSYGIVERHGGRIHVDSRPGEGTTFRVILPLS
jgi:two-component system, NtrC family, sensor kinase